jgi:glycine/D-amino acid oxidase-like deaminating enzyme
MSLSGYSVALPTHADVAIVGAGAMGLFTALSLSTAGRKVVVIDRGRPWREASGVNAGSLGVQNKRQELVPFALEAMRVWSGLDRDLGADVGYRRSGGLRVAVTPEEREKLLSTATRQREMGVQIEWLEGALLRRWAPYLSGEVTAATFCPDDGFASALLLGPALVGAARRKGVSLVTDAPVTGAAEEGDEVRLVTPLGEVRVGQLLVAAGAWTARVAALFGVHLRVDLDVDMLSVTEPSPPIMAGILSHARGILTLKQFSNGSCIIGGGWQGHGDLDTGDKGIDYVSVIHNLRLAASVVPALSGLHVLRHWAGFEGVTPDSLPYFGRLPGTRSVFVLACARGGWTVAPLFGRLMAELMLSGRTSMPLDPFDPGRFGHA